MYIVRHVSVFRFRNVSRSSALDRGEIQFYSFGCMNIRGTRRGNKRQRVTNPRVNDRAFLSLAS